MRKVAFLPLIFIPLSFFRLSASPTLCLTIQPDRDSLWVCEGSSVILTVTGGSGSGYSWSPEEGIDNPDSNVIVLTPIQSQWYYVTDDSTCTDSIYISVNTGMETLEVTPSVTDTICPLDVVSVTITASGPVDALTWTPEDGLVDPASVVGTEILPRETTEYIVTAEIRGCTVSDTFQIDVVAFRFELVSDDTLYVCLGDTTRIRHTLLPALADVVWSPLDTTITVESPSTAAVYPPVSAMYSATATYEECGLMTTTFVRVDSLPDTTLTIIPVRDPYCAGEQVTIFAERADTMKYPDIEFEWLPMDGQIQDSANTGNVLVTLQDTTTFYRVMTQNACIDTSQITVNVIPPDIPLSVEDTMLCPGDMFMVEILDPDVTDIEWMPTSGLSCSDCIDPIVTVQDGVPYTVTAKKDRCTVMGMLNVNISPEFKIPVTPSEAFACPGDEIEFAVDLTGLTNVNISVTGAGAGSVSCSNCPNPIVTYGGGGPIQLIVTADEDFDMFCGALGSATITLKPDLQGPAAADTLCADVPTTLNLNDYGFFVNPSLSLNNGSLSCTNCTNPTVTTGQTTTLFITSESSDTSACFIETPVTLFVPIAGDAVNFEFDPEPPYGQGDIVAITLVTDPPPVQGSAFTWIVNGNTLPGNTATVNAPLNEGENTIMVTWENSFGCMQQTSTTIEAGPPGYRIPKAFTPTRELNTHFKVEITGNLVIEEMLVFNRWGQVVYEGTSEDGWDGRRDGEPAPAEVYTYLIRLRYPNGRTVLEKGDVTLIR